MILTLFFFVFFFFIFPININKFLSTEKCERKIQTYELSTKKISFIALGSDAYQVFCYALPSLIFPYQSRYQYSKQTKQVSYASGVGSNVSHRDLSPVLVLA